YTSSLNPEAVRGAMISLAIDYGVPILWSRSPSETARLLARIATREQREMGRAKPIIRDERKPVENDDIREYLISSIPGVDAVRSRSLLKHFGSVAAVLKAEVQELLKVEGIGEKTAKKIREIVDGEYRST
ncbi:MAG: helix-hairpin-helix domain-containing protein, partial [Thermoprotei archaeon]